MNHEEKNCIVHFHNWSDKHNFTLSLAEEWERLCPLDILEDRKIKRGDSLNDFEKQLTMSMLITGLSFFL